jgi:hypothetical protein
VVVLVMVMVLVMVFLENLHETREKKNVIFQSTIKKNADY